MGQNTLKINEGICQRVIRTCKKSTLIWKNFPIKKYRGEGFLAKNAVFFQFCQIWGNSAAALRGLWQPSQYQEKSEITETAMLSM